MGCRIPPLVKLLIFVVCLISITYFSDNILEVKDCIVNPGLKVKTVYLRKRSTDTAPVDFTQINPDEVTNGQERLGDSVTVDAAIALSMDDVQIDSETKPTDSDQQGEAATLKDLIFTESTAHAYSTKATETTTMSSTQKTTTETQTTTQELLTSPPPEESARLKEVFNHISSARRIIRRNSQTANELAKAQNILAALLSVVPSDPDSKEAEKSSNVICQGTDDKCKKNYVSQQITLVFLDPKKELARETFTQYRSSYPNLTTYILTASRTVKFSGIKAIQYRKSYALELKNLAAKVNTPHMLLIRHASYFDDSTDLFTLLQNSAMLGSSAEVVGGSYRFYNGNWFDGCHQFLMKNYTFKIDTGYDRSKLTCIFCDYLHGPFLVKPNLIIQYLNQSMENDALWLDFFTTLWQNDIQAAACTDVMFYADPPDLKRIKKDSLRDFAIKHILNRVTFPDLTQIRYSCEDLNLRGGDWYDHFVRSPGFALPICYLEELSLLLRDFIESLEIFGIHYQLSFGTALGAAKFGGILPWERDGDLYFDAHNYSTVLNLTSYLKENFGYQLEEDQPFKMTPGCNYHEQPCASFDVLGNHWRVGFVGVDSLETYGTLPPTRVYLDGIWAVTDKNPVRAFYTSHRYGKDIYAHCEHGWNREHEGKSGSCPVGGEFLDCRNTTHYCLNQYVSSGSIQFRYP